MPSRLRRRIAEPQAAGRPVLIVLAGSNGAGKSQENALNALAIADAGIDFDNSDPASPFRWVETWERGRCVSHADYM
jgi:hypothetical protein